MTTKIKLFIFFIFFWSYSSILFAENKILFIDIDFIYSNSSAGKKVNDKIKDQVKKINIELNNYQKELQIDKDKLISQKNVLSQEELQKQSFTLEKKAKGYNKIISDKNSKLTEYKKNVNLKFYQLLTKVVEGYAVDNSVEMIVKKRNILIGKNSLDATQDILNLFNKDVKDIKIK